MIGGIDQQIQQKVDAYRGNPQQLMQRYQQNQELIDLLALQKLKSEKDAAAREMQMQMQTSPQTIKQQREAELLGRTKDEMVQQTSGIMQERAKRQQQNMQRTANQGLPQLPAGNMQKMAGGGIVAFAEGGPLQQEDVNAQLRQMIDAALELGESPEALAERLKDNPNALAILRSRVQKTQGAGMGERPAEAMDLPRTSQRSPTAPIDRGPMMDLNSDTALTMLMGGKEPIRPEKPEVPDTIVQDKIASMKGKLSPSLGSIDTSKLVRDMGVTPLSEKPIRGPEEGGGLAGLMPERKPSMQRTGQRGMGTRGNAEPDGIMQAVSSLFEGNGERARTRREVQEGVRAPQDALQEIDMSQIPERIAMPESQAPMAPAPAAPTSTPTTTPAPAPQGTASVGPRASFEGRQAEYEKLLKAQQDPEKMRKERLRDFLLGAGGRSSFGSVMAGGTAAAAKRQAQQEAAQRSGIEKLMGVDKELMGMDTEQAKLEIERQTAEGLRDLRNMQAGTQRLQALGTLYNDANEQLQVALMQDPEYQRALEAVAKAEEGGFFGVDEQDIRAARMQLSQALERITRSMPNYLMLKEAYDKMLREQSGVGSATAGEIDTSQFQVRQKS